MFEILNKYESHGNFDFTISDNLRKVCNAPKDKRGIYIVSTMINGYEMIIYIGCSGLFRNGKIKIRKDGLYGRLANGKQRKNGPTRNIAWPSQMEKEHFESINIKWWDTGNDCPEIIEHVLLSLFKKEYDRLPIWNNELKPRRKLKGEIEEFIESNNIEILKV